MAGDPGPVGRAPVVAAVTMGYGHLRAAAAVAEQLGVAVTEADRAPVALPWERRVWQRSRAAYEGLSRLAATPGLDWLGGPILDRLTRLPAVADGASTGAWATRSLDRLIRRGLGAELAARVTREGRALVSTFYAPALAVERWGDVPVACVATDADLHRVWAATEAGRSRVLYLAPSEEAGRRLVAYGVPPARVVVTGFPLPGELLGGEEMPVLRRDLAERLGRLDGGARFARAHREAIRRQLGSEPAPPGGACPRLTFAVGGAGALAGAARDLLGSVRGLALDGRLRLALVAGTRLELARRFSAWVHEAGLADAVEVVAGPDFATYWTRFNALLRRTDLLWTKPSELVFYAGLGLATLLDRPVGEHEGRNRSWLLARGAALEAPAPRQAAAFLEGRLADGSLATAAWRGFASVPRRGLYRVVEVLAREGFTAP